MYKNFNEFIVETISNDIPFYLSIDLRMILEQMKNDGNVNASSILMSHGRDVKSDMTYINISNRNDMVPFIHVGIIGQLYNQSGSKLAFKDWISEEYDNPKSVVWSRMRNPVKVGKFLNKIDKIIGLGTTGTETEEFVLLYKINYDIIHNVSDSKFENFEVVTGENIRKWYLEDNYVSDQGDLGNSCMRKSKCQEWIDLYCENTDVCRLLILKSQRKGKISGRALIWKTDKGIVMDRIYFSDEPVQRLFKAYEHENKLVPLHNLKNQTITVQLTSFKFDKWPYLDTFKFINTESGKLYNMHEFPDDNILKLKSADGTARSGGIWSEHEREWLEEDEAVESIIYGWLNRDNSIKLDFDGVWYPESAEEVVSSKYFGGYYHADESEYSDLLEDWLPRDKTVKYWNNDTQMTDFIPIGMKSVLVDTIQGGEDVKSLVKDVIFDPIGKKYHLITDEVDGVSISDWIAKRVKILSIEELAKHIKTDEIDYTDFDKMLMTGNRSGTFDFKTIPIYFKDRKKEDFHTCLRFFLILHCVIGVNDIEKVMCNQAEYSYRGFNNLVITDEMNPYSDMLSSDLYDLIMSEGTTKSHKLAWTMYNFALIQRHKIIQNPEALFTFNYEY